MARELNGVFKAKTRVGQRKILDKFDISKEDKNKFLNGIEDAGSGDSGSGDDSNIEYLDVSGSANSVLNGLKAFGLELRLITDGGVIVLSTYCNNFFTGNAVAVSIDFNKEIIYNSRKLTVLDAIIENSGGSVNKDSFDSIPRITKEQFYSLE